LWQVEVVLVATQEAEAVAREDFVQVLLQLVVVEH
jgi:hypothetical protein